MTATIDSAAELVAERWQDVEPSAEAAAKFFPPTDVGPVWARNDDGEWLMPEDIGLYTIGWDVITWCEEWLTSPQGTGSLEFTPEQMRVILWKYAITEDGKWAYWKSIWQSAKGAGKDPFGAALCVAELIGPCRFSHWEYDSFGRKTPVAREEPNALVQLVGVSKEQTDNTMDMIPTLLNDEVRAAYGLEVQKEIVYADNGKRSLRQVGRNPDALQGKRSTFVLMNEVQHWYPSQRGPKLYSVLKLNTLKTAGHFLMISNAYEQGEDSILERIRRDQEEVWAGRKLDNGWLYMSREAHPESPLDLAWLPYILDPIYGDAWWQKDKLDTIAREALDGDEGPSQIRRMFLNQILANDDAFFTSPEWDRAEAEGMIGTEADLKSGDEIVMGFDGGKSDDATALVALRIRDKLIVPILVEQKPADWPKRKRWEVDRQLVDEEVKRMFATYTVRAFFADVELWESYIATWSEEFRGQLSVKASSDSYIGWDMRQSREKVSQMWELYRGSIVDGRLKHNGNKQLRLHALNARRGHNGRGLIARKEKPESPQKIDLMVASFVAFVALQSLIEHGTTPKRQVRQRRGGPSRTMQRV